MRYLQSYGQANEVHHHLLVSQLDGQQGQSREEQLKALVAVVFLLAAQVDVTVERSEEHTSEL